jgi:hypothetical protein
MVSGRCCYDRCACAGFKAGGADPYVCAACGHHEMLHAPPPRAAPPATTWFYVRPKQGLCNRIRVLSSSLLVVDDLGKPAGRRRGALARAFRAAGVGGDGPAPLCLRSDHGDRMAAYCAACPEAPRVKIALDWETMEPACATLYERLFAPHPLIAPLPPFAPSPRLAQFGDERARVAAELNAEIDLEAAFAAARRDDGEHDVLDANADAEDAADPYGARDPVARADVLLERAARTKARRAARAELLGGPDRRCALWRARALAVAWSRVVRHDEPKWVQEIALTTYKRLRDALRASQCVAVLNDAMEMSKLEHWDRVLGLDPSTRRLSRDSLTRDIWRNDVVVLESLAAYYPPGYDRVPDGKVAPDGRAVDDEAVRVEDPSSESGTESDAALGAGAPRGTLVSRLRCAALNSLRPSCAVRRRVPRRTSDRLVGFHVRRTDNALSIARSPIGGFLRALDRLAAAGDAGRGAVRVARGAARAAKRGGAVDVYVASDAPKAVADLRAALARPRRSHWAPRVVADGLGSKRVAMDGVTNRSNALGVQDALVDLLVLAQADAVVGSYWSSFSEAAALWRRVALVVVDEARDAADCEKTISLRPKERAVLNG